ncbi:glycerate kinase [Paucisalibacillus globulus]|uniref:glycerate kinase n=1 Tax=Paucisalibacillus globulus TaxID=351095 RepID=UPI000BB8E8F4|nr:glycerate kinase [Paucisalibacillus globulus]
MKVLIAIDSFKGSISSVHGSEAIAYGIRDAYPNANILITPLADGGEGTVEALVHATGGRILEKEVIGPLGDKVKASYGTSKDGNTAFIEVAAACGLPLLSQGELNPMVTTTYGVGELIIDAMENGYREFIIGLGGSSTNDAGVGMLQALGFRFLDHHGKEVSFGGRVLASIEQIDSENVHPLLRECTFHVACDVRNPLYGNDGAAYIYGPQKGATPEMVKQLDAGLRHYASIVSRDLKVDIHNIEGAGAAGGLGAAFSGFLNGKLQSGIDLMLNVIDLEKKIQGVDMVITGEGMLDSQTSMGKAPSGIAQIASSLNIPVIAIVGAIKQEDHPIKDNGLTACFSIVNQPMSIEEAMDTATTYSNLQFVTSQIFSLIKSVKDK